MKKKKEKTYTKLKKELDEVFSKYIRSKDAKNGWVNCFTCDKKFEWKQTDAGHYINRKHLSTRWYEKNVKPQCWGCNRFRDGNKESFAVHLEQIYGHGILQELQALRDTHVAFKYHDLEEMIKHYQEEIKKLPLTGSEKS
jgi:hypothetical protein